MFLVTNRALRPRAKGLDRLGNTPSPQGANELRLVEAKGDPQQGWELDILPDRLTPAMRERVGLPRNPTKRERQTNRPYFASYYVAHLLRERVNPPGGAGKNLLFFVHGYNNDLASVLSRCHTLGQLYNAEVLAFTWPADGGGWRGSVNYLDDKRDAQMSAPALNRVLDKFHTYLLQANHENYRRTLVEAEQCGSREERDRFIADRIAAGCPFRMTLMCHSMGNYLLKQSLKTTTSAGTKLTFDNAVLVAADVNNLDHALWLDRLNVRRRVYVTINEDDYALGLSRAKVGGQQLARLGHYGRNLESTKAAYIDFTDAPHVGQSHAYFEGDALRNQAVQSFFMTTFNGDRAEEALPYDPARNAYELRRV